MAVLGLTATPYPTSIVASQRFKQRFGASVVNVSAIELINEGVLARPMLHNVDTRLKVELTESEKDKAKATYRKPSLRIAHRKTR